MPKNCHVTCLTSADEILIKKEFKEIDVTFSLLIKKDLFATMGCKSLIKKKIKRIKCRNVLFYYLLHLSHH